MPRPRKTAPQKCGCRAPKQHRECAYCGATSHSDGKVCGVCAEGGIDATGVIRGTARRVCSKHRLPGTTGGAR